ncbi:MAG: hypothetical protein QW146_00965 [Candidatus Bathyarchaeia archaeon]
MEAKQENQEEIQFYEEKSEQEIEEAQEFIANEQPSPEQKLEQRETPETENEVDRSSFMHGLAVGLGMGCIATFVIMWIAVFFTPQIPHSLTYESLLSIFIYPMLYLLTIGLVALTAGIIREYYTRR